MESYYWFDFETFGINPAKDRPSQFAGIRTDLNFNVINEPLNLFCRPANDFLPQPEACLVTGISPQQAVENGVCEREFFRQIHLELSTAETCAVGFNNIRFDDEVIRFGLYRNFFDAYAREWQNGNSRWDIIDMLRMTHALRPGGIQWPLDENGIPSFRLEKLTTANHIEHANAHDALADVYATIAMARLVREKQPRLFNYLFSLRDKRTVAAEIDLINHKPFVHCSGMLGSEHQYCAVMMPLVAHPVNKNSAICIDLTRLDFSRPENNIASLDSEEIRQRIFLRKEALNDNLERFPIKEIHYNKCPAVAPVSVLNEETSNRLGIDLDECLRQAEILRSQISSVKGKLISVYQSRDFEPITNPDLALYSGGFFTPADKTQMDEIRRSDFSELAGSEFQFKDLRLEEMLFRYRARNAPESLSEEEQQRWKLFRQQCLFDKEAESTLVYEELMKKLDDLQQSPDSDIEMLNNIRSYADKITAEFRT